MVLSVEGDIGTASPRISNVDFSPVRRPKPSSSDWSACASPSFFSDGGVSEVGDRPDFLMHFLQQLLHLLDEAEGLSLRRFLPEPAEDESHCCEQLRRGVVKLTPDALPLHRLALDQGMREVLPLAAELHDLGNVVARDGNDRLASDRNPMD